MAARTARKTAAASKTAGTANLDLTFQNFLAELINLCEKYADSVPAAKAVAEKAEDAAEDDADEAQTETAKKAPAKGKKAAAAKKDVALEDLDVDELRKRVLALGEYDEEDVEDADKETLIEALRDAETPADDEAEEEAPAKSKSKKAAKVEEDEDEDADDEDEDSDEDDEDAEEEGDEYTREDLEGMKLADLRKIARDEYDATPAQIKGLDKDALIEFMLEEDGDDDSDADEDEEEDGYTADELKAMDTDELKEIVEEWELDLPKKATKAALVKLILEAQEEGDDEE